MNVILKLLGIKYLKMSWHADKINQTIQLLSRFIYLCIYVYFIRLTSKIWLR